MVQQTRESSNQEGADERRVEERERIESDGIRIEVVRIHDENDADLSLAMNCSNG